MASKKTTGQEGDFLPNLCTVQAVLVLILVGELLAFALVVMSFGAFDFSWVYFGMVSFLVQWIVLSSAACLCPLRSWLRRQNGIVAGSCCYAIVLLFTALYSLVALWLETAEPFNHLDKLADNLVLAAIFAGVVLRYFYLQQQLHNRQQAELKSRLQALQSRIRPHFLFNSMNSIASLIEIDPAAAEKMVVDLSQLFRASLSEPALVPIEKEIALCKQFVSIEQARLGGRLELVWQIDTANQQAMIPSLLLQPIIENAIYHGIQPLKQGGRVDVSVLCDPEQVAITVKNPLPDSHSKSSGRSNNGIALDNIRGRLAAHFGKAAKIDCRPEGAAFIVDIRYPITSIV